MVQFVLFFSPFLVHFGQDKKRSILWLVFAEVPLLGLANLCLKLWSLFLFDCGEKCDKPFRSGGDWVGWSSKVERVKRRVIKTIMARK